MRGGGRGAGQGGGLGGGAELLAALHTVGQSVGAQGNRSGFTGTGTGHGCSAWPGAGGEAGDVARKPWRRTTVRHMELSARPRLGVLGIGPVHRTSRVARRWVELAHDLSTPKQLLEVPVDGARE